MRQVSFILVLSLAFACGPSEYADKYIGRSGDEIVGGETFVGLPAVGSLTFNGNQHCTGTVIGPTTVLTAAHCVAGMSPTGMEFLIGPSLNNAAAILDVVSLNAHPNYNAQTISNDIATVELASVAPVAPMQVATSLGADNVGDDFLFVGYGLSNGYQGVGAGTKRAVWIEIDGVGETQFSYSDAGKNTCNGDSGGPAFLEENGELFVAGVTSYGDYYCTQYGVDTRVDAFLDFLDPDAPKGNPAEAGCGEETFTGRCDGTVVIWCENNTVQAGDCAQANQTCGLDEAKGYYACKP